MFLRAIAVLFFFSFFFSAEAQVLKSSSSTKKTLPYLGPGTDLLSPEEYIRVYSQYIRESIRWGFEPNKCEESSCERSLNYLFRSSGLFSYPVPSGADVYTWIHPKKIRECYASGGVVAQIERESTGALKKVFLVYSRSPRAAKRLKKVCKDKVLRLDRNPKTSLERVADIPVGYPHPLLCSGSQGLFVRELIYNRSSHSCVPMEYRDNSWNASHTLSLKRCSDTKDDFARAWSKNISPRDFAKKERIRQHNRLLRLAVKNGMSEQKAIEAVKKYFVPPIDNELVYTGMAMRNIEACNRLGIGSNWSGFKKERKKSIPRKIPGPVEEAK